MSLTCTIRFVLGFVLFVNAALAQRYDVEKTFLEHLTREGLLEEKMCLLKTIEDSNLAIVRTEKAWTTAALGHHANALRLYQSMSFDSVLVAGFHKPYMRLLFMSDSTRRIKMLLEGYHSKIDSHTVAKLEFSLRLLEAGFTTNALLPEDLSKAYNTHLFYKKRSLALATALSVVMPGMGKLYLRKPRQGLNMLLANVVLGVQALESYLKAGPESFRFIAFGSLFAVFYTGNIYGTIKGLKKARKDAYKQLHHEISDFYLADFGAYPY